MKKRLVLLILPSLLTACAPAKIGVRNEYTLLSYNSAPMVTHKKSTHLSLLVSVPEALAGYKTEQMHYIEKPFELSTFTKNAWSSSPANLLYPLLTQRLKESGYFHAVIAGPYVDKADYRLDTQLIALHQNFLVKPSVLELTVNVMLTQIEDNRVVASKIIKERVTCPTDTPYGGVIAANKAAQAFVDKTTQFVITNAH